MGGICPPLLLEPIMNRYLFSFRNYTTNTPSIPHQKQPIPFVIKFSLGLVLLIVAFTASMMFGAAETTIKDVWLALFSEKSNSTITLLREIRLPREIAAIFVGAALAVAGAVMQGVSRNPLADPGLLGVTAGANTALAVSLAFFPTNSTFMIMLSCFVGAAFGTLLVFGIASMRKGGFSPLRIVLAGAAISAFLFAISDWIGLYFKLSKNVSMWTAGGLIGTTWVQLQVIIPFILLGILFAIFYARQLTVLSLSEEVAIGLGQKTTQTKIILFTVIIILAGAAVALIGNLAFIGLMVPHMIRPFAGTDYRFIIPLSAIGGASFLLIADTLARVISAPYETPIAAIVAVAGLPFFLLIVKKGGVNFS